MVATNFSFFCKHQFLLSFANKVLSNFLFAFAVVLQQFIMHSKYVLLKTWSLLIANQCSSTKNLCSVLCVLETAKISQFGLYTFLAVSLKIQSSQECMYLWNMIPLDTLISVVVLNLWSVSFCLGEHSIFRKMFDEDDDDDDDPCCWHVCMWSSWNQRMCVRFSGDMSGVLSDY
jgi:hypothetical protein